MQQPKLTTITDAVPANNAAYTSPLPQYTGRQFLIAPQHDGGDMIKKTAQLLQNSTSISSMSVANITTGELGRSVLDDSIEALMYPEIGVTLISGQEEEIENLKLASQDDGYIVVPELVTFVPNHTNPSTYISQPTNTQTTWGLQLIGAHTSPYAGRDVGVAILDTGFKTDHPDFQDRPVFPQSLVPPETYIDGHGHGTHCVGTACGRTDVRGCRYGVAGEAIIYPIKVLNDNGKGAQQWAINGIFEAVRQRCRVISMSFGSAVLAGQGYQIAYERAARYAMSQGSVVVAAAGNDSRRSLPYYAPVGSPADCPSIISVGALDRNLRVADFSARSINPTGTVDITAPGVDVYSSWASPNNHTISGTSMATPHVAGALALLWEKYPYHSAHQIREELLKLAKRLTLQGIDVGRGLCQTP